MQNLKLREPLPHQGQALSVLKPRKHAAIFMDMRLGKSLVVLRWLRHHDAKLNLLVAPDLPLVDWQDECWKEGYDFQRIGGTKRQRIMQLGCVPDIGGAFDRSVVAVTYGTLRATPELMDLDWDAILLDESTAIKNPGTKTFKCVMKWFRDVRLRAVLSGLPAPQKQMEIFTQMAFVLGGKFMGHENYWRWRDRFFMQAGFEWFPRRGARDAIKKAVHENAVVMTKEQAGLKRHVERKRMVGELTQEQWDAQQVLVAKWELGDKSTTIAAVVSTWLEMLAGGHGPDGNELPCWKYDALRELLVEQLYNEPVVVWAKFNNELNRIAKTLEGAGIKCAVLNGEVEKEDRGRIVRAFREGTIRVLLCQPALVRYGVDLSNADASVFFSCGYSFENRRQAEERTSHPKKERPTAIIDLITKGSADEAVMDALRERRSNAAWFMSRIGSFLVRKK